MHRFWKFKALNNLSQGFFLHSQKWEMLFWDPDPSLCPSWPLPLDMFRYQIFWFLVQPFGLQKRFSKKLIFFGFKILTFTNHKNDHISAPCRHFLMKFWYVVTWTKSLGIIKKICENWKILLKKFLKTSETYFWPKVLFAQTFF